MYSNVKYPMRLCVELLHYCAVSNSKVENKKMSEIKRHMEFFFTDDEIRESTYILTGFKVE